MKTRILSLLLLISMLITAIPVMASAEENAAGTDAPAEEQIEYADLHTLYVQDGLTNLFTTFGEDAGYDFTKGTWTAKIGTGVATLGEKSRWSKGEYGGIGYSVFYGTMIDGTYVASPKDDTESGVLQAKYNFNNHNTKAMRLEFGLALLPKEDFTVEYLAMYKPIYVADMNGNIAVDANGKRIETYNVNNNNTPSGGQNVPLDAYGWFTTFAVCIDGRHNLSGSVRSGVGWFIKLSSWYAQGGNGDQGAWRIKSMTDSSSSVFQRNHYASTYSVSIDETLETDAEGNRTVSAIFSLYRDGAMYKQNVQSTANIAIADQNGDGKAAPFKNESGTTVNEDWGNTYVDGEWKSGTHNFWIAAQRPIDFYGARIYDRALTPDEKMRNRAIDVLLYYGIQLDKKIAEDAIAMKFILAAASAVTIKADAVAYSAGKAALENKIAACANNAKIISEYAAIDNLTSFFTTFADDTVDLAGGTWADLIGGGNATLTTPSRWSINANGSVGYNAWAGYVDSDGAFSVGTSTNADYTEASKLGISMQDHAKNRLNALELGIDRLPSEDFTVEYMAMYKPTYVADLAKSSASSVVFATNADGSLMERFIASGKTNLSGSPDNDGETKRGIDAVGWFRNYTYAIDGYSGWSGGSNANRGTVHWCFDLVHWGWNNNAAFLVSGSIGGKGGVYVEENPYQKNNVIRTFGIYVDETVKDGETEALFGIYYNATKYADNSAAVNSTANIAKYDQDGDGKLYTYPEKKGLAYYDTPFNSNTAFYLSSGKPTDFFGVRVYDKVLTDEEKLQNHRADFVLYYDLDLSPIADEDILVELFYQRVGSIPFESDAVKKAAKATELQTLLQSLANDYAHVARYAQSEHLVAFFTTFMEDQVDMEVGSWQNLVGSKNATLVNLGRWFTNANGSIGYNVWSGKITDDGTVTTSGSNTKAFGFDKTNYVYNREGHLDLGIELLPSEDITVELVAMTRPILMADAEESSATQVVYAWDEANGKYFEAFEKAGKAHANIGDYGFITGSWLRSNGGAIDAIGRFGSFDITPDGAYWEGSSARGNLYWMNTITGWTQYGLSTDRLWLGSQTFMINTVNSSDVFMTRNVIRTYTYSIDETPIPDTENGVTVVFNLYRDAVLYKSSASKTISTASTSASTKYNNEAFNENDSRFYFGSSRPTDFFALRVYDVTLTDAERKHNHVLDVYYYYGLTMPDEMWENEEFMAEFARNFENHEIATSTVDKAAWKIKLQTTLDRMVQVARGEVADYESLYVQSGLVALYFADESVSLVSGVWENKVAGGASATLRDASGKNYWQRKDYGIGYTMTYTEWATNSEHKYVGLSLPDTYAELDDFTVETFAKVEGTTIASGDRYVVSGQKYKTWCSAVRLGLLTSLFFGNTQDATNGLALRWSLSMTGYTGGSYQADKHPYGANGIIGDDQSWLRMGPMLTPTAGVMQITKKTVTVSETSVTNIAYNIAYNNASGKSYQLSKEKYDSYLHFYDGVNEDFSYYGDYADLFSLFNGVPATIYAVRVYDRELTAEEKAQNRLVDLMYYYDVAIPEGLTANCNAIKTIAACANAITISEDSTERANIKATIEAAIQAAYKNIHILVGGVLDSTVATVGDTYILPDTVGGKRAVAFTASTAEGNFAPGSDVEVAEGMTIEAIVVDTPTTSESISLKAMSDVDGLGIRFTASLGRADFEIITSLYDNVRIGMLIAPVKYVQGAGGVFTRDAIRAYKEAMSGDPAKSFVEIWSTGFYAQTEDTLTISGALYNFSRTTREKNPDFTAVAFIDIDANGDGLFGLDDFTVYGSFNPLAKHNVKTTMNKAYEQGNLTDTQKQWIKDLISNMLG